MERFTYTNLANSPLRTVECFQQIPENNPRLPRGELKVRSGSDKQIQRVVSQEKSPALNTSLLIRWLLGWQLWQEHIRALWQASLLGEIRVSYMILCSFLLYPGIIFCWCRCWCGLWPKWYAQAYNNKRTGFPVTGHAAAMPWPLS